jgi:Transposase IS66 family
VTQDCHKAAKARLLVVTIVKALALPLWSRLPCPHESIEKCLATDQIVIDTVVSKYCDHQPLYRQSAMLERDSGVELSRASRLVVTYLCDAQLVSMVSSEDTGENDT